MTRLVSLRGLRILLVEDEYFLADEMAELLRDRGAEILGPFARVQPALTAVKRDPVHAALLDVRLDGETSESLASVLTARGVPVLLVTGYERAQLPVGMRSLPSLRKPFSPAGLLAAVETLLAQHYGEQAPMGTADHDLAPVHQGGRHSHSGKAGD
jgi:DNA-binding response OmpR family regulator